LCERFLTEKTLGERALSRLFSLLLAVDVLECRAAQGPGGGEGELGGGVQSSDKTEERGLAVAARRLATVFADETFAKCGAFLQQNHCCGLLVRSLLHLGIPHTPPCQPKKLLLPSPFFPLPVPCPGLCPHLPSLSRTHAHALMRMHRHTYKAVVSCF